MRKNLNRSNRGKQRFISTTCDTLLRCCNNIREKNRLTHKKKQAINKRDTARLYSKTRPVTGVLKQPLRQK